jgi:hypothetical protein
MLDKIGDTNNDDHKIKLRLMMLTFMKDLQESKTELMSNSFIAKEIMSVWTEKENQLMNKKQQSDSNYNSNYIC